MMAKCLQVCKHLEIMYLSVDTHVMYSNDVASLIPRRISAATSLPSSMSVIDSLASLGHEDTTASQNDTASVDDGVPPTGTGCGFTCSSVRWEKEEHTVWMRSAVTSPLMDRVSLCTRGQTAWGPSCQKSRTDQSSTSSSVTGLSSRDCNCIDHCTRCYQGGVREIPPWFYMNIIWRDGYRLW